MGKTTNDPMAMAQRMRTLGFPDHVTEDLIGVKFAPPPVMVKVDDTETEEAPEVDETEEAETVSV